MIQRIKSDIWSLIMLKRFSITIHGTSFREIQGSFEKIFLRDVLRKFLYDVLRKFSGDVVMF